MRLEPDYIGGFLGFLRVVSFQNSIIATVVVKLAVQKLVNYVGRRLRHLQTFLTNTRRVLNAVERRVDE